MRNTVLELLGSSPEAAPRSPLAPWFSKYQARNCTRNRKRKHTTGDGGQGAGEMEKRPETVRTGHGWLPVLKYTKKIVSSLDDQGHLPCSRLCRSEPYSGERCNCTAQCCGPRGRNVAWAFDARVLLRLATRVTLRLKIMGASLGSSSGAQIGAGRHTRARKLSSHDSDTSFAFESQIGVIAAQL